MRVYECRAEPAANDDPLSPADWQNRTGVDMEKHFLADRMEGTPEFRPEPWYNPYGDCIIYQMADEAVVARRVDELLTVYHSAIDNRPIGFQIKGVVAIIKKFGLDGMILSSETGTDTLKRVSIALLLLAAYEDGPRTLGRRRAYATAAIACPAEKQFIPADEFVPA